ncbi:MAG: ABC transporter substrate-binding protein [Halodesulfurarchaeum sp.]
MALDLTLSSYHADVTRPLMTGEVEPEGMDLTTVSEYPPRRHRRFFRHGEFDAAEVSLASYLSAQEDPEQYPFTAIPVFPERKFRHSFLYKHVEADIEGPRDLADAAVGIQSWQTTANVWIRGALQDQYGLDLESVTWYRRREDDAEIEIPDRYDVRPLPDASNPDAVEETGEFENALLTGDLDAAMDPAGSLFNTVVESDAAELFFEDPIAEERAYYEETGIYPPMHVVAIRDEILESHPWVAVNLFDAFVESRDRCFEHNKSPSAKTSLAWSHLYRHEQRAVLGPGAWEYGLTKRTEHELRTFSRYASEQGLTRREYDPAELFFETTLDLQA